MIDIETSLFNELARPVMEKYPGCYVASKAVVAPPKFPALTVIQSVNSEVERRVDTSWEENANSLTYDGTAQTLVAEGTSTGGEMQYSIDGKTYAAISRAST